MVDCCRMTRAIFYSGRSAPAQLPSDLGFHFFESYHYKSVYASLSHLLTERLLVKMYREAAVLLAVATLGLAALLDGDLDIADGVKLVSVPVSNSLEDESRSFNSPIFRMAKFLQGHELHVKLPNIIEKDKISQLLAESLKVVDETYKSNNATGRGKGDGGGGGLALLGLMFAKTVGAAGIGGLGLLTMKALAVSALALMLSAIVGVKKLASHDDHDDHQVIYAGHHGHHRRRRELDEAPLPYRGWTEYRNA